MDKKFTVRFMNKNAKKRHKAHFELKKRQGDKSLVKNGWDILSYLILGLIRKQW